MKPVSEEKFKHNYQSHLRHLKLKGLQPKTIEAYSRAIRRIGAYFDHQIDALSEGNSGSGLTFDILETLGSRIKNNEGRIYPFYS